MDVFMSILPAISSVGATTIIAIVFKLACKKIIADKQKENNALKYQIKSLLSSLASQKTEIEEITKSLNEEFIKQEEEIKLLKEQVEAQVNQNKDIEKLIDEATTVRNQLNTLLNEKGE